MALGYAPTVGEVLDYYGPAHPDVEQALARAAQGRRVEFYHWPTELPWPNGGGETLQAHIRRHLETNLDTPLPQEVPPLYPGLHGTIEKDIVLEVDDKTSQRAAWAGGKRIQEFLDGYGAPYRVKFSGNCSAHFIIPQDAYEPLIAPAERPAAFRRLYGWIIARLQPLVAGKLDESFFQQEGHHLRLPYSLNEWTGLVSLPVCPEEYDAFEPALAEIHTMEVAQWWFERDDLWAKRDGMRRLLKEALGDDILG